MTTVNTRGLSQRLVYAAWDIRLQLNPDCYRRCLDARAEQNGVL